MNVKWKLIIDAVYEGEEFRFYVYDRETAERVVKKLNSEAAECPVSPPICQKCSSPMLCYDGEWICSNSAQARLLFKRLENRPAPRVTVGAVWRVGDRHKGSFVYERDKYRFACDSRADAQRIVALLNAPRVVVTREQLQDLMFFYTKFNYKAFGPNEPLRDFEAKLREIVPGLVCE